MVSVLGAISYWLFGYAIAWGEGNSVIGWNNWAWSYLSADKLALAFNQLTFANSASTITSGSVAERLNLTSYYVYGVILTGLQSVSLFRIKLINCDSERFHLSIHLSMGLVQQRMVEESRIP